MRVGAHRAAVMDEHRTDERLVLPREQRAEIRELAPEPGLEQAAAQLGGSARAGQGLREWIGGEARTSRRSSRRRV